MLNGEDVLGFDGADDFLSGGDILDSVFAGPGKQFEMFAVVNAVSGSNNSIMDKYFFVSGQRQLRFALFQDKPFLATITPDASNWRDAIGSTEVVSDPNVLVYTYDGTQIGNNGLDRFAFRVNGNDDVASLIFIRGGLFDIQDSIAPVAIGSALAADGTTSDVHFNGDIAEIILYERLLATEEREQVEAYLGEKYGIALAVAVEDGVGQPQGYRLSSIYPNPFAPQASFQLEVARAQQVRVSVHDLLGREVAVLHEGVFSPSVRTFTLRGEDLGSGVYFVRVAGAQFTATRRAVVIR